MSYQPIKNEVVAAIQEKLIDNSKAIGITVPARNIGNFETELPDGDLGRGSARAIEQLNVLAQLSAGIKPENVKKDLTPANISRIETYLNKQGVSAEDTVSLVTFLNIAAQEGIIAKTYDKIGSQINPAEMRIPETQLAQEKPIINIGNAFVGASKTVTETMHSGQYFALSLMEEPSNSAFKPRMDAYERALTQKISEQLQNAGINLPDQKITEMVRSSFRGKQAEDPQIEKIIEAAKKEPVSVTISKADINREKQNMDLLRAQADIPVGPATAVRQTASVAALVN